MFELRAPDHWRAIDFISDLHLGESTPAGFDAWTRYLHATEADAVFMLGDLFEVWVGNDAAAEPGSIESRGREALADAGSRRWLGFMAGNRDFLLGADLLHRCRVAALPDPTVLDAWGRRVLLTHGDALCIADTEYQSFRATVRSPAWQHGFLALPLDERRRQAQAMRDASREHQRLRNGWADVDTPSALDWMRTVRASDLVHGHTHRPADQALAPGLARHVLSDWDCEASPPRAEVLRLTRTGFARQAP